MPLKQNLRSSQVPEAEEHDHIKHDYETEAKIRRLMEENARLREKIKELKRMLNLK